MTPDPVFIQIIAAFLRDWEGKTADIFTHLPHLQAERANLYRVVSFGLEAAQTFEEAAWLVIHLFKFIETYGHWQEWIPLFERALHRCPGSPNRLRFEVLNRLGQLHQFNQQLDVALKFHQQALVVAEQLQDLDATAQVYFSLCLDFWRQKQHHEAEEYGQTALTTFRDLRNEEQTAVTLNILGLVAMGRGEYALAEQRLEQAIALSYQVQPPLETSRMLHNLVSNLRFQKRPEAALVRCEEALRLLHSNHQKLLRARILTTLGAVYLDLEQIQAAETALKQAYSWLQTQTADLTFRINVINNLGHAYIQQKRYQEAEIFLQEAVALCRQTSNDVQLALSLGNLAEAIHKQGGVAEAKLLYAEAIVLLDSYPEDAWARFLLTEYQRLFKEMG